MIFLNFSMMEFGLETVLRMVKTSKFVISLEVVFQVICLKLVSQESRIKLENQVSSKWLTAPFIAKPCLPIRRGPS